ncbi:MAG TPA: hypothetical protein VMT35_00690 [Ignavibacteriaceae bacterium]|nr:hypothetical protein [Ignavibacteriaceae bacterium]
MSTSMTKTYQLRKDEGEIKLTIIIGEAQLGVTSVSLENDLIVNNETGKIEKVIGRGNALIGKSLFCGSTVTDVRTETNKTSITYRLEGGVSTYENTLQETVNTEGAVIRYNATFFFF